MCYVRFVMWFDSFTRLLWKSCQIKFSEFLFELGFYYLIDHSLFNLAEMIVTSERTDKFRILILSLNLQLFNGLPKKMNFRISKEIVYEFKAKNFRIPSFDIAASESETQL
ncbi:hypothetical protein BpHYR1_050728 [Brachionus plicatilis]|uniref:Uncharacterized protein n=1 Tax=Brachionus plicatilis TaxID=10195 RepID=A0A3M7PFQ9_BRAPC|nr:hypothetical protein BpHYR1_050728 [Brachionus plicatilis]